MDNKISNVIGVPIPEWLVQQFETRSAKGAGYGNRNIQELKFLSNKTAWVRVVSSIQVSGEDMRHFNERVGDVTLKKDADLAKNFILFAGTSKYKDGQDGKSYSTELRSGINQGSYGMLGSYEVEQYGYTPMPGITSVTIETMGRMGSVRSATINFRVFNKAQLDIIDALYFKLGYTMLLEWGHTYYYRTPANKVDDQIYSTEELMIDPFALNLNKEKINYHISRNVKKSYGNYDGMLGVVTNFNFSRKEDGSYDCTLKIIGLGAIAESLKINRSNAFTEILKQEIKKLVQVENAKIQARIDEQTRQLRDQQIAAQSAANAATKAQAQKLTLNQIFEQKIASGSLGGKLQDFLYIPGVPSQDLYDLSAADIVYADKNIKNRAWGIRKFGIILEGNTQTQKVTLSTAYFKKILPTIDNLKKGANKQSNEIKYNFLYEKGNNGKIFVKDKLTIDQINNQELSTTAYQAKKYLRISHDSDRNRIFGLDLSSYGLINAVVESFTGVDIIDGVYQQIVYDAITKDHDKNGTIEFDSVIHDFVEVVIPDSINFSDVNSVPQTNKLNTNQTTRYYPILKLSKNIEIQSGGKLYATPVEITISDSSFINSIVLSDPTQQVAKEFVDSLQNTQNQISQATAQSQQAQQGIANVVASNPKIDIRKAQEDEAAKFQSALESALRLIQIYTYNRVRNTQTVQKKSFTENNSELYNSIFKRVGLYSKLSDVLTTTPPSIPNYGYVESLSQDKKSLLEFYVAHGFNVSVLSNSHSTPDNSDPMKNIPVVNHKDLIESYVIPYNVNQQLSQGIVLEKPIYIKLGTLLMLINHLALMYDSEDSEKQDSDEIKTPIFYVDYHPETNFCLSSLNHLSTNPFNFMIPYSGKDEDFKLLFDPAVLPKIGNRIFTPSKDNRYSAKLPQFLSGDTGKGVYRGKIMNVLIDIDYILSVIKQYSDNDNTNSIYFKPFMDKLLADMCKALGNYNLLRLAYNDAANCFYIVDDQIVPPDPKESEATRKGVIGSNVKSGAYEIPLYGNTSIAKNLEIKTDISSRLSNMIAISANSEKNQGVMGTDSTPFGYINKNFRDRYVPLRSDISKDGGVKTSGDEEAAIKFNDAVKQYYKVIDINLDSVNGATNYYISRMAQVKSQNKASRASAIIPVSLNFTTDGVSGFNMYQSFGINEELLPYTYTATNKIDSGAVLRRVGFCVVGLTHTIENNQWNTSVKSNMIFLKDPEDYVGERGNYKVIEERGENRGFSSNNFVSADQAGEVPGPIDASDILDFAMCYLCHNQGTAGAEAILYYTFKEPKSKVPVPNKFAGNTNIDGNMYGVWLNGTRHARGITYSDWSINVHKDFRTIFGSDPDTSYTPGNFVTYQFKYNLPNKVRGAAKNLPTYLKDLYTRLSSQYGVPLNYMIQTSYIESGHRPLAGIGKTIDGVKYRLNSKYKGLFGLSYKEFYRYFPSGDIHNAEQNATAGAQVLKQRIEDAKPLIDEYRSYLS